MSGWWILLIVCAAVVGYVYVGYPLLLWCASSLLGKEHKISEHLPPVTLIIPAHNEQKVIAEKIRNSLELDYPKQKLQIIVASDGSDDQTNEIAAGFAAEGVEWAVVEVGLGGRLDSTNVVSPRCCVVTNIGFDHTDRLGDTPEAIAAEKAGIIKPGVPVVVAPQEPEFVTANCSGPSGSVYIPEDYYQAYYAAPIKQVAISRN